MTSEGVETVPLDAARLPAVKVDGLMSLSKSTRNSTTCALVGEAVRAVTEGVGWARSMTISYVFDAALPFPARS